MSDSAVLLAQAFRILEREARLQLALHSSLQDLNAYRSGELSPEQERRLQWHFALCFQCADRLLDLQRFLEPVSSLEPLDETGSWWDLQDRLARETWMRRPSPPLFMALAAALAPAVVGLLVWNLSLQRELLESQANFAIASIEMPGTSRAAQKPMRDLRLPSEGRFSLSVDAATVEGASNVRLEIFDPSGHQIESLAGMRRSEFDTFDVLLSRERFPNGEYRIVLIGQATNGAVVREETRVRIVDL